MFRKINIYLTITVMIILMTVSVFAATENSITYDYTSAGSRAEHINNPNPDTYSGTAKYELKPASCEGFEFAGWYLDPDCRTEISTLTADISGDLTLYAKWYEMSYDISYVLTTPDVPVSAADVSNPNVHIRLASEEIFLSEPSYISDDYTFEGWYLDNEYTKKIDIIDEYTCENLTLYAHWVNTVFPVSYELGAVSAGVFPVNNPNPDTYTFNENVTLADAHTDDPSYTFEGWYTDESFSQRITEITKGTSGRLTLYANWTKKEYKINYVLADKSGIKAESVTNTNDAVRTADSDFTLSAPVTTDKNYEFAGWYTSPELSDDTKISSIKAGVAQDMTLYAKWEKAVYEITFNYGNIDTRQCKVANSNPTEYRFGDSFNLSPASAEGYIFNSWCTDEAMKNPVISIDSDDYGDITLYAYFTEKTYSITYITEDKEVTAAQVSNTSQTVRTTSERVYFDDAKTINTDYKFGGWYYDAQFTQQATFIKPYTAENVTVYAKWVKINSYLPVWGDVTLSEELSAADARLILRYSAGLESAFNDTQLRIADLNNDSKVNAADARLAIRLSAGLDKSEALIKKYSLPQILLEDGEVVFK